MRVLDSTGPADGAADALREALRENQRLTDRCLAAEQQVGDLAALYAAVNTLHAATSPAAVAAAVSEIVANLLGSEELALFESDARHGLIRLVAVCGVSPSRFDTVEIGTGIIGTVADTGRPFVRQAGGAGEAGSDASITACLPLRIGTSVAGVLAIFRLLPHKGTLEDGDRHLLEVLSAHVAPALLFARVYNGGHW